MLSRLTLKTPLGGDTQGRFLCPQCDLGYVSLCLEPQFSVYKLGVTALALPALQVYVGTTERWWKCLGS